MILTAPKFLNILRLCAAAVAVKPIGPRMARIRTIAPIAALLAQQSVSHGDSFHRALGNGIVM